MPLARQCCRVGRRTLERQFPHLRQHRVRRGLGGHLDRGGLVAEVHGHGGELRGLEQALRQEVLPGVLRHEVEAPGRVDRLLGFGGMRFGAIKNRERSVALMLEAARAGVTYFDTAPDYFGTRSEETFGDAFREMRRLGLPFLSATKTFESTERGIRDEIEAQLARLGVPAIDFYHAWCIKSREGWAERKANGLVATFRKLKEEGLVRHLCVSSHLIGDEIRELLMEGVFEGVLFGYSAYNFHAREKAFEAITARHLGAVVMNPLGGGLIPQNPRVFDFIRDSSGDWSLPSV